MTPLVTIGSYVVPEPSEYTGTTATIVDSARNAEGYMIGAVIRDDVGKVQCKWNYISAQNWANILSLFSSARGGSFTNMVTFYSQDSNGWETREMYVNDRTAKVFKRDKNGNIQGYLDASLSLIEV